MNVFYNSLKLPTLEKNLDFGDVFQDSSGTYFICITALCDCLRPTKTDYIFYFAKGEKIGIEKALKLGDAAFISFIGIEEAVVWSNIDKVNSETAEEKSAELDQFRYKPIYIKPLSYLVSEPQINDGKIELARIFQYKKQEEDLEFFKLKYLTTIKHNYTQRIANHAFTHPTRVGVDFVKKD
jgi:hypothetical protein